MGQTVRLTASFKLSGQVPEGLFSAYHKTLTGLLEYASEKGITSFKRLRAEKYRELREKYPNLPSHYLYTACQMASIATHKGRIRLRLLHGTYHEKFRGMKAGEAWLVKSEDGYYLKVAFSKTVETAELNGKAIAVDVNENNVSFGTMERVMNVETKERAIRTAYFLKRRRLQSKPRLNEKLLLAKYRGRERRRIEDIYHKVAKEIVAEAIEAGASVVVLEDIKNIRKRIRYSRALNGRLIRRFQKILEYKARLAGLKVAYVDPRGTSSLCPTCGGKLSPNGHRGVRCPKCGLEEDRDVLAVRNLLGRYQMYVGTSPVHPEGPPMKGGGKT